MAKVQKAFFCQSCGSQFPRWMGRCSSCGEWNTLVEEILEKDLSTKQFRIAPAKQHTSPIPLAEVQDLKEERILLPDQELNRVTGGGLVMGSLTLIGGEPGIGKSTLMLQMALGLQRVNVLYISGEESLQQIKLRATRIGLTNEKCLFLAETRTQQIFKHLEKEKPSIVIVDSIQTLQSAFVESGPGSVAQVRECAAEFLKFAKETSTPVMLIGHITKEGTLAGPKVLEHMVDTVLQFEGDSRLSYRILRTMKNRFGSTNELGIYHMQSEGLLPVKEPSTLMLGQREQIQSGIAVTSVLEGNRPLMIEVQALVTPSAFGTPQRSATGFDGKRLNMLLAVLDKRAEYRFGPQDVFLNITGGFKIQDPAADVAVAAALASNYDENALPQTLCCMGEVGLGGELRTIPQLEKRLNEAERLGFEHAIIPKFGNESLTTKEGSMELYKVSSLNEMFALFLTKFM